MELPSKGPPPGQIIAAVDKDHLRSLFYLLAGKPDSTIKLFPGPFELDLGAIDALNARIVDKLRNHHVEGVVASVFISYSNKTIKEFGSWAEFESHRWTGPEETEDVTVRWEFLVSLPNLEVPQRHTLTVRAARGPRPAQLMQWLLSQAEQDRDPFELALSPMYCRVDFINPILGAELINLVSDWHASLKRPIHVPAWINRIRKRQRGIKRAVQYSVPLAVALACLGVLRDVMSPWPQQTPATVEVFWTFGLWLVLSMLAVLISRLVAEMLGDKVSDNLDRLSGSSPWFALTNGDRNRNASQIARGNKSVRRFLITSGWAIALNLIAAYIAVWFGWS